MISDCVIVAKDCAEVEWIISNDDPDSPIKEDVLVSNFKILVLQTDVNEGYKVLE